MNDLVFLEPNKLGSVPFTTSKVIAEMTGIEHRKLKDAIRKHQADIEVFGILARYEPIIQDRGRGQPEVVYKLNEEQATLLMTLLKNTPTVVEFKVELVRQFYAMRKELTARAVARAGRIPPRRDMTDAIRDCVPDSPHKARRYKQYTDLAYKAALGRNAVQLRKERNAPKGANMAEYLTAKEIEAVSKMEGRISVLLEMGMDYDTIKAIVLRRLRIAV
ncbi:MAG: Rha family transcriptional regulator [Oscillibacter sp.]|nr:Rha family transcriptional regulator [Oscillibacter sp.]